MLIALAYALGISAAAILLLLVVLVLVKRIKTIRNPAAFKARVRLAAGAFPGLTDTWQKGYGNWVTNVLAVRKGIPLNIADVLPTANLERTRTAATDEAAALGLGNGPVIATLALTTGATIELAMRADKVAAGLQPYAEGAARALVAAAAPVAAAAEPPQPAVAVKAADQG